VPGLGAASGQANLAVGAPAVYDHNTGLQLLLEDDCTMAQIKKPWVRQAILDAALHLFQRQTYQTTTLAQIARAAGVSSANLYVSFESKLDSLYAVYEPWMRGRLTLLEVKSKASQDPLSRLRLVLRTLWRDIPAEQNGFVNNIMQALSTAGPREKYNPSLLHWMEERISTMMFAALPPARRRVVYEARLAHVLVMALDGYSIHNHINPPGAADDATIDAMARLLLGTSPLRRSGKRRHAGGKASGR
jgi:AcrR family transcriptional regulator